MFEILKSFIVHDKKSSVHFRGRVLFERLTLNLKDVERKASFELI